jgi:hypothetical protein
VKSKRSHDRSPDKIGFSIALPRKLVDELKAIAIEETRTRNGQIEHFLAAAVAEWKEREAKKKRDAARSGTNSQGIPNTGSPGKAA